MTAVLQFEIEIKRVRGFSDVPDSQRGGSRTAIETIYRLARASLRDTFDNGGTFVMVVSEDMVTIVQRAEATDFDKKAEAK